MAVGINDLSGLSQNFGWLDKGILLGFDLPILDTYIPGTTYGMFRYEKDGGGGSADTLAFLSGQAFGGTTGAADGANTPAANNHQSSFWTMLSELDTSGSGYNVSRLIFEPIIDDNYDALGGEDDGYFNYSYIGFHNPLYAIYCEHYYGGNGTAAYPSHSFTSDVDTGMYLSGANTVGFACAGTLRANISASGLAVTATVASDIEANINSSSGLLTKVSSSRRYKDNIADLDINTENIYDLRPVSFDWKSNGKSDFGYIAEEVHEILPELVVYDDKNRPEAVKYKQLSILMLEELKKLREEVKDLKEKQ